MAKLKLTEKEKRQIYNLNYRVRKIERELDNTYGINFELTYLKPSQIRSRKQFKNYIATLKPYASKKQNRYHKGGISYNDLSHFYAISDEDYQRLQNAIRLRNTYAQSNRMLLAEEPFTNVGKVEKAYASALQRANETMAKEFFNRHGFSARGSWLWSAYDEDFSIRSDRDLQRRLYVFEHMQSPQKLQDKAETYKLNYANALYNIYGTAAEPLTEFIMNMDTDTWIKLAYSDTAFDELNIVYMNADYADKAARDLRNKYIATMSFYERHRELHNEENEELFNRWATYANATEEELNKELVPHTVNFIYNGQERRVLLSTEELVQYNKDPQAFDFTRPSILKKSLRGFK